MNNFIKYKALLDLPIKGAAYSGPAAWLLAEMSRLAYLPFEKNDSELKTALSGLGFELARSFDREGTQAFLAARARDKAAVLAFRGTQQDDPQDIIADLKAKFYQDKNGAKVHDGFYQAFQSVENDVKDAVEQLKGHALYVTGHSLGGALALIATRALNSDHVTACYTFGSPRVGSAEFDDEIKSPIYRVVNAYDLVPASPPTYIFEILAILPWPQVRDFAVKFSGYVHHGEMKYLSPCGADFKGLQVISNYNDFFRLIGIWTHRKESIKDHDINIYCAKLGYWALQKSQGHAPNP